MIEGQKCQDPITLPIRTAIPTQHPTLTNNLLSNIGNDIPMRQHDTLRLTRRPRGINQKRHILRRSDLLLTVACSTRDIAHRAEMFDARIGIPLVSNENNAVLRHADFLRGFPRNRQHRGLRYKSLSMRVLELEGQLVNRVTWVRRRDDSAGPECAPHHDGRVDAVWCEEGENIALAPLIQGFQALAEI